MEDSPLSTPFGAPVTSPPEESSSASEISSTNSLTIAQLANLPRPKKPLPRFLLALIIVSVLAVVALLVSIFEALEISRLNSSRGLDPSSLSVLVWKRNAPALTLSSDSFAFEPSTNTLELTDLSLGAELSPDNPVISSFNPAVLLRPVFVSSPLPDGRRLVLILNEGVLASCYLAPASAEPSSLSAASLLSASSVPADFTPCTLSGVNSPVYKLVEFSAPSSVSDSSSKTYLAFIFTDGSVDYLSLSSDFSSSTLSVLGPLNLSGFVRDILPLSSTRISSDADGVETATVSDTAVFVLSDGTYLLFDPTML